jgi:Glucose / Sorbosone dehydrogenase
VLNALLPVILSSFRRHDRKANLIVHLPTNPFHALKAITATLLLLMPLAIGYRPVLADPPCVAGVRWLFRPTDMCAETLVDGLRSQGIASISGLAFGTDGSLYFARPATREIFRLPSDHNGSFGPPTLFASLLPEPPNGLAYDAVGNAWYVSADTTITRLRDANGDGIADEAKVIVKDLPGGTGGWLGNIRVGPDRRLYVAKASSCDACIESDPRRAALLSFALDGSDAQVVARGLRDSYDFDWNPADGTLYIVDDERSTMPAELNALKQPDADFGWPRCDYAGQPVQGIPGASVAACQRTLRPVLTFDLGSHPAGISFYQGQAFPAYRGGLLVALSGSWNAPAITGYELLLVRFDASGKPTSKRLLPNTPRNSTDASLDRTSFYPYHMTAIAISPEGWIYISVAEGRIYRFRPMPIV